MIKFFLKSISLITLSTIFANATFANSVTFTPTDTFSDIWVTIDADLDIKSVNAIGKEFYGMEYCINWGSYNPPCRKISHDIYQNSSKRYILRLKKLQRDSYPVTVTTKLGTIYDISEKSPTSKTPGKVINN